MHYIESLKTHNYTLLIISDW